MSCRLIIGSGALLGDVHDAWRCALPDERIEAVELTQRADYSFDLAFLDERDPAATTVFAAFDNRFLNFKRLELMSLVRARGFKLDRFVSPAASVSGSARIGENSFVSAGTVIGAGAQIGFSVFLGPRTVVGAGAEIGNAAWLAAGVIVEDRAKIGAHCTLGAGVCVAPGISIGRLCVIDVPGRYRQDVAARTFFNPDFDEPIRTFN